MQPTMRYMANETKAKFLQFPVISECVSPSSSILDENVRRGSGPSTPGPGSAWASPRGSRHAHLRPPSCQKNAGAKSVIPGTWSSELLSELGTPSWPLFPGPLQQQRALNCDSDWRRWYRCCCCSPLPPRPPLLRAPAIFWMRLATPASPLIAPCARCTPSTPARCTM
jgi:hypothetical protein